MIIKHGRHIVLRNSLGVQRYVGFVFRRRLCQVWMLIGWAGILQSYGDKCCILALVERHKLCYREPFNSITDMSCSCL